MTWKNIKYNVFFIFLLFIRIIPSKSQIVYDKSVYHFGTIQPGQSTFIDFKLTNAGKKTATIRKVEEPYGISYRFSSKIIPPDSSIFFRVKYIPKKKETFRKDIYVWVDVLNEPLIFSVEGNNERPDLSATVEPPDFTESPVFTGQVYHYLELQTIDKQTRTPVENVKILVLWDGLQYKTGITDYQGKKAFKLPADNFYVVAFAPGYETGEADVDIQQTDKEIILALDPKNFTTSETDSIQHTEETPVEKPPFTELDPARYAPNNIVFLLDISVSMKQQGRLDLLKSAMIELVNLLRPIDKLSIVTYASETKVWLEGQPVTDRHSFIQTIQELNAGGYTAGSKGMKKAYEICRNNFLPEGNNQIFIATDGAFNLEKSDKEIIDIAEKAAKNNIKISVIGVKNEKWTEKSMKQIADISGGTYIQIKNYKDAQTVLIEEIKKKSLKY